MGDPELIGDWVRERVLGCGGFGVVTLWKNTQTSEQIAIKKYRGETEISPKQRERWTQEVDMMKKIQCKNIVSFKSLPNHFEETLNKHNPSNLPMLSMEYCTQGDLRSLLSRSENCCGLLESDIRYILLDLMTAVSYLHSLKITHRDLKPENIVLQLSDRPNGMIYKLIDLGYAKELDATSICASFVGTMQYLAPELLYSKTYSCSVDYWSMGLVAFEIICGCRPFLPNKSPAQWMLHVHKKSSDVIAIHQLNEEESSVTSYNNIFPESHISSVFRTSVESWLRLALEYIPRKRGYSNYDPEKENTLDIFTKLQEILEKKVITVFVVWNCMNYSYEVDECTRIETVLKWVERDSKIKVEEQVVIGNKGSVDVDGLVTQIFDESYSSPMLYIFKKSEILTLELKPQFPILVEKMLQNSLTCLQYYFQKRSYAHALFFIFTEIDTYNTVLVACSLRFKNILRLCDQISHKCRQMNINVEKLIAQKDFSQEVLEFDCKQYLKNYSQQATHWTNSLNAISNNIEKLHEVCNQINVRHESAYRRATNISMQFNKEFSKHNDHDLNKLLDEGIKCYSSVKARSKEHRNRPENCRSMAKIVYNVLKTRDKLLRDKNFRKYLQVIVDLDHELDKMSSPLNLALDHIEKYKNELLNDHLNRQTKIWEFTIKQKAKREGEPLKPNFLIGNPNKHDNFGTPISLEKPLHFILGPEINSSLESNSSFHSAENSLEKKSKLKEPKKENLQPKEVNNGPKTISIKMPSFQIGEPTSDMINHNLNLRHELEEKTLESFRNYKSILSEPLDFSFLNE